MFEREQCVEDYAAGTDRRRDGRTAWTQYVQEALRLAGVVGVQPYLRVRPHALSLAEGLEALAVDGADQDLT